MLETLKARKEALEARGEKGFTLMEMLIVIAIIAILIAIAIPVFTAQLERAGEATDAANIRAGYAEAMANYISNASAPYSKSYDVQQKQAGWQNDDIYSGLTNLNVTGTASELGVSVGEKNAPKPDTKLVVKYESKTDGNGVTVSFE